jgi:hypothetical protein
MCFSPARATTIAHDDTISADCPRLAGCGSGLFRGVEYMLKKETIADEHPHYYSRYWLAVAAGQAGVPLEQAAPSAGFEEFEPDEEPVLEPEQELPPPPPKPVKQQKPERRVEPARPVLTSLADLANIDKLMQDSAAMDAAEVPDIETGAMDDFGPFGQEPEAETVTYDAGEAETVPLDEEGEEFGDLDFDEEEDEWGDTRRPGKQPKKPPRRERRPF